MNDDCPMFDEYGIEWKDGSYGCTVSYQHLLKLDRELDDHYWIMGTEMGLEMDFEHHNLSMEKAIDHASHMVGLDNAKPYKRHGKLFYKPYRNYWDGFDAELDYMSHDVFGLVKKCDHDGAPYYVLTRCGLDWLGRRLNITIYDEGH